MQFIYGSSGSCANEIGFARSDNDGSLKKKKIIVKAESNYRVTPLDYQMDELLFMTELCSATAVGSVSTLWRLNLGNKFALPKEVYSLTYQGTRSGLIVDAKIDLASNKTVVMAWINGDQQIVTAETNPLLIWSLSRQGWLLEGIYASAFDVDAGWSLSVYGNSINSDVWRSVYVDWRTDIEGFGKIIPRGYGTKAQFQGRGSLNSVVTGILKMPYIFETSQGVYVCSDYPSTSGPVIDVDNNPRCNRISGNQRGQLTTSFAKGKSARSSSDAIISSSDKKAYIFNPGPIFGTWSPVKIEETIDLASLFRSLPGIYYLLSTYETFWDIGEVSPSLIFKGFFSNNNYSSRVKR